MKREQRHTVHYLAARAKNGDEWSLSLLQRLSELARGDGTQTPRPLAEGLSDVAPVGPAASGALLGASPSTSQTKGE